MKRLITAACFAACAISPAAFAAPPAIDTSTPANALKSYWAFVDWREQTAFERQQSFLKSKEYAEEAGRRAQVMASQRLDFESQRDKAGVANSFQREIVEVKMDGENGATVTATIRNVTPLDSSKIDMSRLTREQLVVLNAKKAGDVFQYRLERQPDGWRVTGVSKRVYGDGIPAFDSILVNPVVAPEFLKLIP